jgi:arsenate reductase
MPNTLIYHNPQCSKSRQSLALLRENNVEPQIIEYLKNPPSKEELKNIVEMLGVSVKDLLRKGEAEYKEIGFQDANFSEDEIIDLMVKHPKLIERPIIVSNGKAAIGRPPENVLEMYKS